MAASILAQFRFPLGKPVKMGLSKNDGNAGGVHKTPAIFYDTFASLQQVTMKLLHKRIIWVPSHHF